MNNKSENMKLLGYIICASIGVFIAVIAFSSLAFYINGYFQFKDWTILVVSLAGALMGGIFTMLGVVLTLNRSISDREEADKRQAEESSIEKKESIKTEIFIVKTEIEQFLDSIKNAMESEILLKHQNAIPESMRDLKVIENINDWLMEFEAIYFLNENVKYSFFDMVKNIKYDNKEVQIKNFVYLYQINSALKYYLDKEHDRFLYKIIFYLFKEDVIGKIKNLFEELENLDGNKSTNKEYMIDLEKRVKNIRSLVKNNDSFEYQIENLNLFLDKINGEYDG
ncbi:hypothetical protein QTI81_01880 [Clostridium perfringens]|nr:hypothetical protein [Clostridium perfringens]MDM0936527.1 hypothetical protein [Clostridium perfringens]